MKNPFKAAAEKIKLFNDKIKSGRLAAKLRQPEMQRNILAGAGDGFLLGTLGVIIAFCGAPLTLPVIAVSGGLFALGLGSKIASTHIKLPDAPATPETTRPASPGEELASLAGKAAKPDFVKATTPSPAAPGPATPAAKPDTPKI